MTLIFLIARHEFLETLKSKSFLISLILIPAMLAVGIFVPRWLEQTTTVTRNVIVIDADGGYESAVRREIKREQAKDALAALNAFIRAYAYSEFRNDSGQLDPEKIPIRFLKSRSEITDADADAFLRAGGLQSAYTMALAFVEPGAPPPVLPPQSLRIVDRPEALDLGRVMADPSGTLAPYLADARKVIPNGVSAPISAVVVFPPGVAPASLNTLAGIGRGASDTSVQIWVNTVLPNPAGTRLERVLNEIFSEQAILAVTGNPDADRLTDFVAPIQKLNIGHGGGRALTRVDLIQQLLPPVLAIVLVYFLYINMYMLMSNTMEEKSNRIIEVLISSVTPKQLMIGKLLGSSLVALFMFGFSVGAFLLIFTLAGDSGTAEFAGILLDALTRSSILPSLFVYFILGYFLFAGIFLTIGSFCENNKDIQSLSTPIVLFMIMVPLVVWAFSDDPNGGGAQTLSWLPFFGPFMMMARASSDPAWSEIVGSISVQLLTIIFLLWLAERLFRIAILHTGRPPRLSELWRSLRDDQ